MMQVMTLHEWFDRDIESVRITDYDYIREIELKSDNEGALLIHKLDVIALAKEFGLVVYEKNASL